MMREVRDAASAILDKTSLAEAASFRAKAKNRRGLPKMVF